MNISRVMILEVNAIQHEKGQCTEAWQSGMLFKEMTKALLLFHTPGSTAAFVPAPFPTHTCSQRP